MNCNPIVWRRMSCGSCPVMSTPDPLGPGFLKIGEFSCNFFSFVILVYSKYIYTWNTTRNNTWINKFWPLVTFFSLSQILLHKYNCTLNSILISETYDIYKYIYQQGSLTDSHILWQRQELYVLPKQKNGLSNSQFIGINKSIIF